MQAGNLFVMGAQIGRLYECQPVPFPFGDNQRKRLAFLMQLVKLKRACRKFLTFGKMLRPVKISPSPEMIVMNGRHKIQLPSILTSSWKSPDGDSAIVLVNLSSSPSEFNISFDACEYGCSPNTTLDLYCRTADGILSVQKLQVGPVQIPIKLEGTRVLVLELKADVVKR